MEADTTTRSIAAEAETSEIHFRAMGTRCHVLITGPTGAELNRYASERIDQLERRWSRFVAGSEINQLNTGDTTSVSTETCGLIERAAIASNATSGIWNPLMGRRINELGYDRPFQTGLPEASAEPQATDFCHGSQICIDAQANSVTLPAGCAIDVGGIAKGFAADLVSQELMAAGAWGTMVNLGGDLRVRGMPPTGLTWVINVGESAIGQPHITTVHLTEGGIATSTVARRRWRSANGMRHHLIDPRTSLPSTGSPTLTTVIAGEAWWAEVAATALTIAPEQAIDEVVALQVHADGTTTRTHDFERYES